MTRSIVRRILFAVVAAIALAAFAPMAQASTKPRHAPMVAGVANYHGPEPGATPIYDKDLVVMRRVMNILVDRACDILTRGPSETKVYTCERKHSECHRGDNVPYPKTTGVCSGDWHLKPIPGVSGFPALDCDMFLVFFRRSKSDGSTEIKRLPHSRYACARAIDA